MVDELYQKFIGELREEAVRIARKYGLDENDVLLCFAYMLRDLLEKGALLEVKMKAGVLRRGFTFETVSELRFRVPEGVAVVVANHRVYFVVQQSGRPTDQPISAFRCGQQYFAELYGVIHLLKPFNPKVPYPLSML